MNDYSEILAVYPEVAAYVIFVALLKEQRLQQAAIFF